MMLKKAYICHPYSGDPENNRKAVMDIMRNIIGSGYGQVLPVCPWLVLTYFLDDKYHGQRQKALQYAVDYISTMRLQHDQLWVYGSGISEGMRREIAAAKFYGIEILNRSSTITSGAINEITAVG